MLLLPLLLMLLQFALKKMNVNVNGSGCDSCCLQYSSTVLDGEQHVLEDALAALAVVRRLVEMRHDAAALAGSLRHLLAAI